MIVRLFKAKREFPSKSLQALSGFFLAAGLVLSGCDSGEPSGPAPFPPDPDAQIVILFPVGGEKFTVGDSLHVKWKIQGKGLDEVNGVNIEVSPDSGKTWVGIVGRSIGTEQPQWGDYAWKVPATLTRLGVVHNLAGNSSLLLKVMQYSTSDKNKIAITRKTFSIQ